MSDRESAPPSFGDELLIRAADQSYEAHNWANALHLYQTVHDKNPMLSRTSALGLAIGHCRIELADDGELDELALEDAAAGGSVREAVLITKLRFRAYMLCRSGEFARACCLLRYLARFDPPIADAYRTGTARKAALAHDLTSGQGEPPFLGAVGLSDERVVAARARWAGRRLLLVARRHFIDNPSRQYELVDNLGRSAGRFGLTVREFNAAIRDEGGAEVESYAERLRAAIADFRPDILLYDELFESGISSFGGLGAEQIAAVLRDARRTFGLRVVKSLPDAWQVPADRLFHGLGDSVDLVHHCHPLILDRAAAQQPPGVFCYVFPYDLPDSTVPPGAIQRACFVGSINAANIARLFWWAEAGKRGLPLDFLDADHLRPEHRSDLAYADLLRGYRVAVNFTRRPTGATILTGRTLQVPLCGGVLLEEASLDTAYFLTPGAHYLPFETLDELAALTDEMLRDDARRTRLATEGQRWVTRHFSGDWFWAGLLERALG